MNATHLYIRNMCCDRCIETVKALFKKSEYKLLSVSLGQISVQNKLEPADVQKIEKLLNTQGFYIADQQAEKTIVKIHVLICHYVREMLSKEGNRMNLSAYLKQTLHRSYHHLSKTFSLETGMTIEKYFVRLKMERAKELLLENVESLSAIAWQLGYSSQQSLSTQFKKETGKTPGEYKLNPVPPRVHWDELLPQHFKQKR